MTQSVKRFTTIVVKLVSMIKWYKMLKEWERWLLMLRQISDYLFMGSLILLIITLLLYGAGRRGMTYSVHTDMPSGATTDLQMEHNHKEVINRQDSMLRRILKSYLFWIAIIGIVVSIVLSKI
jgi:hypothetical protein